MNSNYFNPFFTRTNIDYSAHPRSYSLLARVDNIRNKLLTFHCLTGLKQVKYYMFTHAIKGNLSYISNKGSIGNRCNGGTRRT